MRFHEREVGFKSSVGDLPTYRSLGQDRFAGGLSANGGGHVREGSQDLRSFGPDRDFFYSVVIGDGGFGEAIGDGGRGKAVDAGDLAVAVAEPWRKTSTGCSRRVAAGVNAHLFRLLEEQSLDERIHLSGFIPVCCFVRKTGVRKETISPLEKVFVEALDKVVRRWSRFATGTTYYQESECETKNCCPADLVRSSLACASECRASHEMLLGT
jgi:hypothetical protein